MKFTAALILFACLLPATSHSAPVNLATLTCIKYENEILAEGAAGLKSDPINTVMWLFGFSVAKSGAHVMYGDALSAFGFGLDAECKENPNESLLDALSIVKPDAKNPMDLMTLECSTFATRHLDLQKSDPESATTIMMWLFGFNVQKSGGHIFDADGVKAFETRLLDDCAKHGDASLFDSLVAVKAPPASK